MDSPPIALLWLLIPLVGALAFTAPPYVLIGLDLLLVFYPGEWLLSGTSVDPSDIVFAGVVLSLLVRRRALHDLWRALEPYASLIAASSAVIVAAMLTAMLSDPAKFNSIMVPAYIVYFAGIGTALLLSGWAFRGDPRLPALGLWIVYGTIASVAYLHAPDSRASLTSPVAVAYQLYRYAWKPTLYYAMVVLLLGDGRKLQTVLLAMVLVGDICAIQGTLQSFSGLEATGPFNQKNGLGAFLVVPFLLSFSCFLYPPSRRQRLFFGASVLLLVRGLVSAASRGALVATVAGSGMMFGLLLLTAHGSRRVVRVAALGLLLLPAALALKPDILQRPNVRFLLEAVHPEDVDNYQWRKEERWPYFFHKMVDHPWFGVGADTDYSLGETCATPHNGYLSAGVTNGIPGLALLVLLAGLGVGKGLLVFWKSADRSRQVLGLTIAAAVFALMTHNYVDRVLLNQGPGEFFWLLIAIASVLVHSEATFRRKLYAPEPSRHAAPLGASAAVNG